jgi:uncharacterized protein
MKFSKKIKEASMSIRETLTNDMKTAMRDKNTEKLGVIRMLQAAIKNREIELRPTPMVDDDCLQVMKKMVKQRKESIEQFNAANRKDLADKEIQELVILEAYMPAQMSREDIEKIVLEEIAKAGVKTAKEMGMVMKAVQARTAGAADNKLVSEMIKSKLQA